jgi:hypothetical protein
MRKIYSRVVLVLMIASCSFFSYRYINGDQDPGTIAIKPTMFDEDKEGEGRKQEEVKERLQHERIMTMDPALGYAPIERLVEAEKKTKQIMADYLKENSPQSLLTWGERGPSNMGGRSRSVLINRNDATGNTVLVGSVGGGLWRTTNFKGATPAWTQISSVSANLAISALAQDPSNLNVMYAGTGEGVGNADAIRGLGIYRSSDGGNTWALLGSTTAAGAQANDMSYITDLAVYSDGSVYASAISRFCNRGGVFKSTNGGTSWTRVIGTTGAACDATEVDLVAYDLEISASGDIYAAVLNNGPAFVGGNPDGKIYKSPAGATVGNVGAWANITPAPKAGGFWQRIDLACAPSDNNVVYAIFQGNGNGIDSIMRSDNAGGVWVNVDNTTLWCDQGSSSSVDFSRSQAWYDLIIAVKRDDPATVFAGGVDVMKSSTSGAAWTQATQWSSGCGVLPNIHADIHNIVAFPTGLGTSSEWIVVNDGGIYYTTDNGASFTNKSAGYNTIQYYSAAISPTIGSNYMLAGAQDNGSHKFSSVGLNAVTTATGGDGGFCHIDNDPNNQVTSFTFNQYGYSRNAGASFSTFSFGANGRFINPTEWDTLGNHLYGAYLAGRVIRVDNIVAGTISGFQEIVTGATVTASALKADPNTPDRIWVAFSGSTAPELFYIDGANDFSTNVTTGVNEPPLAAGSYIASIDVDPVNASHILITVSNYGVNSVWESTNLGSTWTSVEGNLPDMPIRWGIFVPANLDPGSITTAVGGVMLATELGVWSTQTLNAGATVWVQNAGTMGNVRVDMLKLRKFDRQVVAATHGRGLFTTTLQGSLPVNFTAFTGKTEEKQNRLMWSVENEVNNKGYEIERKYKNEPGFTKIGFVAAKSANASANDYTFPDALVDLGIDNASYRLKQIDIDGHFKYSAVVTLTRKTSPKFIEYVAVRTNSLLIRMNGQSDQQVVVRLFDNSGRVVMQKQVPQRTQEISMTGLPRGVFVVEVSAMDGKRFTQRIVY